jgi:hypothetical protein
MEGIISLEITHLIPYPKSLPPLHTLAHGPWYPSALFHISPEKENRTQLYNIVYNTVKYSSAHLLRSNSRGV